MIDVDKESHFKDLEKGLIEGRNKLATKEEKFNGFEAKIKKNIIKESRQRIELYVMSIVVGPSL